jgi:hypothetical protein
LKRKKKTFLVKERGNISFDGARRKRCWFVREETVVVRTLLVRGGEETFFVRGLGGGCTRNIETGRNRMTGCCYGRKYFYIKIFYFKTL